MIKTILSVDPGTRYCGIAVFKGEKIMVSMVKILSANGSSKKRLEEVRKVFSTLIGNYAPDVLAIEEPLSFWTKQSRFLDVVINEIKCLAKKQRIKVYNFSPLAVRKTICGNDRATKKNVAELVSSIYPELKNRLNQDRRSKELYWGHMFDAVGLGVCYLKTKQK